MKIAFQGVAGANSEVGIRQHYGASVEAIGFPFSEQVFDAVEQGAVDLGFIPVENTIAGNVAINMDLLLRHDVTVIAEDYVHIQHHLLANPGAQLADIERVYSHPVALEQCRPFLKTMGLIAIPDFDTAGAASALAQRKSRNEAAIAPYLCAEYYGLDILSNRIQEQKRNITRFISFVRPDRRPKYLQRQKTSLAFNTRHQPGALVQCLEQFSRHHINMTRLESRPVADNPFAYTFFVDFLGAPEEKQVRECLTAMSQYTLRIKILGAYPQDLTQLKQNKPLKVNHN